MEFPRHSNTAFPSSEVIKPPISMAKVLFILPPLTQLNTVYPSITHLTAFLRSRGVETDQMDLGIELIDSILQCNSLTTIFKIASQRGNLPKHVRVILSNSDFYTRHIDAVVRFLRGNDPSLATRMATADFWEDMYRMPDEEEMEWNYGTSGSTDRAKYLASLFIKNICEVIEHGVDPHFQLIRYAERLSTYLPDFKPLEEELGKPSTFIGENMLRLLKQRLDSGNYSHIAISIPFPGNLLAGLQCAKFIKANHPGTKILLGGGYVNTELRQLSDPTIFRYVDYITYDDGELPTLRIIEGGDLLRTAVMCDDKIVKINIESCENIPFGELPAPTYMGLRQELYMNFVDITNPMHRLWSDGRWNKLMLAHGCYWAKCAFCDTSLDYIRRYESCDITIIVDRMEQIMAETGISGFHFVDEAAPPALLRKLAEEILRRKLTVSYWTNVRFDRTFTPELCYLLMRSGCIAVSGGLEVASPRVLKLINKGVTVESATECMRNLTSHSIMVHAYLMYGFPTETVDELYDSLTTVRDLFAEGLIHSAFWHRYAMTCHSPSGCNPQSVGAVRDDQKPNTFANNEVPFHDRNNIDWSLYTDGLNLATYNYMRQTGFDIPVKRWFKKGKR